MCPVYLITVKVIRNGIMILKLKQKIIIMRQLDAVKEVATHIQTNILQNFCKTQILFPVITILGHRE